MAILFALLATLIAVATRAQNGRTFKNMEYDDTGNLLDLYLPQSNATRAPLILVTAGQYWRTPNGKDFAESLVKDFEPRGFAVAGINIQTVSKARYPQQIFQLRAAVRFCRDNAVKYGLDPTKFAFLGWGTGGWAAAIVATTSDVAVFRPDEAGARDAQSSAVQSAVAIFPATAFNSMDSWYEENPGVVSEYIHNDNRSAESTFISCPITKCRGHAQAAGARYHVSQEDPDMWLIHGDSDPVVPLGQSETVFRRYRYIGGNKRFTAFTTVKGAGHVLDDVVGPGVREFTTQLTDRNGRAGFAPHMRPTWSNISRFFVSSFRRL